MDVYYLERSESISHPSFLFPIPCKKEDSYQDDPVNG